MSQILKVLHPYTKNVLVVIFLSGGISLSSSMISIGDALTRIVPCTRLMVLVDKRVAYSYESQEGQFWLFFFFVFCFFIWINQTKHLPDLCAKPRGLLHVAWEGLPKASAKDKFNFHINMQFSCVPNEVRD